MLESEEGNTSSLLDPFKEDFFGVSKDFVSFNGSVLLMSEGVIASVLLNPFKEASFKVSKDFVDCNGSALWVNLLLNAATPLHPFKEAFFRVSMDPFSHFWARRPQLCTNTSYFHIYICRFVQHSPIPHFSFPIRGADTYTTSLIWSYPTAHPLTKQHQFGHFTMPESNLAVSLHQDGDGKVSVTSNLRERLQSTLKSKLSKQKLSTEEAVLWSEQASELLSQIFDEQWPHDSSTHKMLDYKPHQPDPKWTDTKSDAHPFGEALIKEATTVSSKMLKVRTVKDESTRKIGEATRQVHMGPFLDDMTHQLAAYARELYHRAVGCSADLESQFKNSVNGKFGLSELVSLILPDSEEDSEEEDNRNLERETIAGIEDHYQELCCAALWSIKKATLSFGRTANMHVPAGSARVDLTYQEGLQKQLVSTIQTCKLKAEIRKKSILQMCERQGVNEKDLFSLSFQDVHRSLVNRQVDMYKVFLSAWEDLSDKTVPTDNLIDISSVLSTIIHTNEEALQKSMTSIPHTEPSPAAVDNFDFATKVLQGNRLPRTIQDVHRLAEQFSDLTSSPRVSHDNQDTSSGHAITTSEAIVARPAASIGAPASNQEDSHGEETHQSYGAGSKSRKDAKARQKAAKRSRQKQEKANLKGGSAAKSSIGNQSTRIAEEIDSQAGSVDPGEIFSEEEAEKPPSVLTQNASTLATMDELGGPDWTDVKAKPRSSGMTGKGKVSTGQPYTASQRRTNLLRMLNRQIAQRATGDTSYPKPWAKRGKYQIGGSMKLNAETGKPEHQVLEFRQAPRVPNPTEEEREANREMYGVKF